MDKHIYINGRWEAGSGSKLENKDPSNGAVVWSGRGGDEKQVERAVISARDAFPDLSLIHI